jgi:hypothetical protein
MPARIFNDAKVLQQDSHSCRSKHPSNGTQICLLLSLACNSWNRPETCISMDMDIYILILTCAYFVCFMDFWNHLSPPTCAAGPSSAHHASTVPHIVVHLLLGPLMLWLVLFLFPSLPSLCFSRSISLAPTPSVLPQGVNQKHQRSIATKAVHLVDKKYKNVPTLGVPKIPKADNCSGLSTRSMARRSPTHRRTICP